MKKLSILLKYHFKKQMHAGIREATIPVQIYKSDSKQNSDSEGCDRRHNKLSICFENVPRFCYM